MPSLLHPELIRTFSSDKARQTPIQSRQTPTQSRPVSGTARSWPLPARRLLRRHQAAKGQA
ncbi:MAG TPA: hypothetical protein VNV17_12430 [Solirubrobacteraceae bacterium]|nr:hypothetical protein [Solirubrobacteraceae bacterium]